jgi:CubicO group peptidase (beta-lactamase class C family)
MKINLIFSLVFLLTVSSFGQTIDKNKLDSLFQILSENNQFMGSVDVAYKGKSIYSNVTGLTDLENKIEATRDTRYRIGSISKMFTTALILQAVDKKKIHLDETIDKWFPKIKNASTIKIRHLLNHRSGIYNFVAVADYMDWNTQEKSREELLQMIEGFESEFKPNTKASYSNSNYVLLTIVLEKTYKKSYTELVAKFAKKLKLKNTYVGGATAFAKQECYSYNYLGSWSKSTETDMSIPLGAGAIISTPADLNSFVRQLFGGKVLREKSLQLMQTIEDGYGSGLFKYGYADTDKVSYGHTGGIDGFRSMLAYLEEDDLSIAICANGVREYTPGKIRIAILNTYYQKEIDFPVFKENTLSSDDLNQYIGTYTSPEVPFKVIITKDKNTLLVEMSGTGQPPIPLTEEEKNIFVFAPAGLRLGFNPQASEVTMSQGPNKAILKKE